MSSINLLKRTPSRLITERRELFDDYDTMVIGLVFLDRNEIAFDS
jgi:hypothetical protein